MSAVAAINKLQGTSISATGVIMGVLATAGAFIWNLFLGIVDLGLGVVNALWNGWATFANFFANVFNDPISSIINAFGQLADAVLGILESIASAIDKVFGSNLASAVSGWRGTLDGKIAGAVEKYGNGSYEKVVEELNLTAEDLGLSRWSYSNAYSTGYDFGAGLASDISGMFGGGSGTEGYEELLESIGGAGGGIPTYDELANNALDDLNGSTGSIEDSLDISNEHLKYLRDLAEQEVINRFTTAEIRVEMGGVINTVNQNADLDGIMDYMVTGVQEAMERVAEGVHN